MFSRLTFDIFTSRYQHERSSNLPSNSSFDYGEASNSSLKIEPTYTVSTSERRGPAVGDEGGSTTRLHGRRLGALLAYLASSRKKKLSVALHLALA
eukprot:1710742-Prymnesium_polylepis.1